MLISSSITCTFNGMSSRTSFQHNIVFTSYKCHFKKNFEEIRVYIKSVTKSGHLVIQILKMNLGCFFVRLYHLGHFVDGER